MFVCVLRMLLGLGGVLLALGMVILAMRIGSSTMGLRCGFVMFRRLVVCVFHFDFSVGRKISAVNGSRLNSGRIEGQSYFKSREPSSIVASTRPKLSTRPCALVSASQLHEYWQAVACSRAA